MLSNGPMLHHVRIPCRQRTWPSDCLAQGQSGQRDVRTGGLASPPPISGLSLQTITGNKFSSCRFRGSAPALQQVLASQLRHHHRSGVSRLVDARGGGVRAMR